MNNMNMKRLSDEGRDSLTVPFTLEEIHKGVNNLKHNSALGPDGLPADFFLDFGTLLRKKFRTCVMTLLKESWILKHLVMV
jgi:hypothetical protein